MNILSYLKIKKYNVNRLYGKDVNIIILLSISLSIAILLYLIGFLELINVISLFGYAITGIDFLVIGILCTIGPIGFYNHIKSKRKRVVEDNHLYYC